MVSKLNESILPISTLSPSFPAQGQQHRETLHGIHRPVVADGDHPLATLEEIPYHFELPTSSRRC